MTTAPASTADTPRPDARALRFTLWTLLVIYILNFLDRQIVNILAEPIKRDLQISDTLLGLLAGPAFAVFYALLGIPIARLADKPSTNRSRLVAWSLAIWSGMTALCGLAQNFWQLLLARIGVGVGEAGCTPAAHSLIADSVPKERRNRAIAFYGMGVPIGTLLGLVIGGVVNDQWGWRPALMLVGLPGVLLALLVPRLIRDPRMAQSVAAREAAAAAAPPPPPMGRAIRAVFANRSFLLLWFAASFTAFLAYGKGLWTLSFFIRTHGLSTTQVGIAGAVVLGLAGMFGTWLGGQLADRWGKRDPRHILTGPAVGMLIAAPLLFLGYWLADWRLALAMLIVPTILNSLYYGPTYALVQGLVPTEQRSVAASLMLFGQNLIGLGLGPFLFGALSDALQPAYGQDSVRYVLYAAAWLGLIPALFYWLARRRLARDLSEA